MRTKKHKRTSARQARKARALKAPVVFFLPRFPDEQTPRLARTRGALRRVASGAARPPAGTARPGTADSTSAVRARAAGGARPGRAFTESTPPHRAKRPAKNSGRQKSSAVGFGQVGPPRGGITRPEDDSQPGDSTAPMVLEHQRNLPDGTARQAPGFNDRPRNWHAFERAAADSGSPLSRPKSKKPTKPSVPTVQPPGVCRSVRKGYSRPRKQIQPLREGGFPGAAPASAVQEALNATDGEFLNVAVDGIRLFEPRRQGEELVDVATRIAARAQSLLYQFRVWPVAEVPR